jgi:hypothetical protein
MPLFGNMIKNFVAAFLLVEVVEPATIVFYIFVVILLVIGVLLLAISVALLGLSLLLSLIIIV